MACIAEIIELRPTVCEQDTKLPPIKLVLNNLVPNGETVSVRIQQAEEVEPFLIERS